LAGEKLDAWLGGKTSFGKVRRYANQIFIKTIDPMIQGAFESSLGSLKVVLQKDKLCVQIVESGSVSAGLPCLWVQVAIKCRLTRQRVIKRSIAS